MTSLLELLTHNGKQGTGYFDVLMRSMASHLAEERELGRISPSEYAKSYVELSAATLQGAIGYLTSAPESLQRARLAEAQVDIAIKELELKEQALINAQKQNDLIEWQIKKMIAEIANIEQTTSNLEEQGRALVFETVSAGHKAEALEYRVDAEYAVTHDTLPDGSPVAGSLGKDNQVKDEQITTFKAKNLYQMIQGLQSSNTAQVTTLGDVTIAPDFTIGKNIDTAIVKYFSELGVPMLPEAPEPTP